jgi:hypothetical protein
MKRGFLFDQNKYNVCNFAYDEQEVIIEYEWQTEP